MRRSTFISAALHTAILLFALVAFPAAKMDRAPLVAIPVDLATPAEVTRIKAGSADAKDEALLTGKPKEKKPEAVREAKKPSEQTAEQLSRKPEAKPKAEAEEAAKAEAKKAKPKQVAAPKKPAPAPEKKRDVNADRIAALLNKIPDAANEPAPIVPSEETPSKKVRGQSNGTRGDHVGQ